MAKLNLAIPVVGEKNATADPKVSTALQTIEKWGNGEVGTESLEAKAVTEAKLSAPVVTLLNEKTAGGVTQKSIIATEESRASTSFGELTTPDVVEVQMVSNGLIAVWFHAAWTNNNAGIAEAAIWVGLNKLVGVGGESSVATLEPLSANFAQLGSYHFGLTSAAPSENYLGDVTTGQVVGAAGRGGPVYFFASAGKYKISVRYKQSAGSVTVKNRKLWAIAVA